MYTPINYGAARVSETFDFEPAIVRSLEPVTDPRAFNCQIMVGTIHQVIPGMYMYRVVFDGYQTPIVCTTLDPYWFLQPVVSQIYPVGTRVFVVLDHAFTWGRIIGAVPPRQIPDTERAIATPNLVSGVGTFHYAHSRYLSHFLDHRPLAQGLDDFIHARMADNLHGDYTISNVFGGGFHTDPFHTFIRQSHSCGVWLFGIDQLLRLMGRSIQEYSTVHERYVGVDEAESYVFEGIAMYPHEGLGLPQPSGQIYGKNEPYDLLRSDGKSKGFMEPITKELVPFYRQQTYSGFIGQGQVRLFFIPPRADESSQHPIAVSKQQFLMDGTLLFESAKGIHLIKHGNIASYRRIRAIEDPQGDDLAKRNYSPAVSVPKLEQGATITDQILHAAWEQANIGFEGHALDFEKSSSDDLPFDRDVELGALDALRTSSEIPKAATQLLYIDERYGEREYSGSRSSISLLPDGGIAIRGGCGEEILLQGGNITLSAPGDLRCLFGRSAVTLAGDDIVLRAKNSVDITATDHDVRLKAERNLDMVGGMAGEGRTLLENQATGVPTWEGVQGKEGEAINGAGIVLRAPDSVLASYGKRVYTKAVDKGEIFLDADNGAGGVKVRAQDVGISAKVNVAIGVNGSSNLLQMTPTTTLMTNRLEVDGQVASSKNVLADMGCNRDPLDPPNFDEERLQYIDDLREQFIDRHKTQPDERYYEGQGLGSEEMVAAYTFSYRNSDQCGAHRFTFAEPFWMELYGTTIVSSLATWEEPVYVYQEAINQTAWPGHEKWSSDACVEAGKTRRYNAESGNAEWNTSGAAQKVTPEEFFRIVDPV